jgi:hypothetical protein
MEKRYEAWLVREFHSGGCSFCALFDDPLVSPFKPGTKD